VGLCTDWAIAATYVSSPTSPPGPRFAREVSPGRASFARALKGAIPGAAPRANGLAWGRNGKARGGGTSSRRTAEALPRSLSAWAALYPCSPSSAASRLAAPEWGGRGPGGEPVGAESPASASSGLAWQRGKLWWSNLQRCLGGNGRPLGEHLAPQRSFRAVLLCWLTEELFGTVRPIARAALAWDAGSCSSRVLDGARPSCRPPAFALSFAGSLWVLQLAQKPPQAERVAAGIWCMFFTRARKGRAPGVEARAPALGFRSELTRWRRAGVFPRPPQLCACSSARGFSCFLSATRRPGWVARDRLGAARAGESRAPSSFR